MSASSRTALGCGKGMRGGMRSPKYTVLSHLGHLDAMAGEPSRAVPSRAVMCRAVSPAPPGPRPPPPGGSRGGAERARARHGSVRLGTAPAQRSRCPVPTAERTPPALSPIPKDQSRDASAPGFLCLGKILHNKQVVVERRGLWGFYRPQRHRPGASPAEPGQQPPPGHEWGRASRIPRGSAQRVPAPPAARPQRPHPPAPFRSVAMETPISETPPAARGCSGSREGTAGILEEPWRGGAGLCWVPGLCQGCARARGWRAAPLPRRVGKQDIWRSAGAAVHYSSAWLCSAAIVTQFPSLPAAGAAARSPPGARAALGREPGAPGRDRVTLPWGRRGRGCPERVLHGPGSPLGREAQASLSLPGQLLSQQCAALWGPRAGAGGPTAPGRGSVPLWSQRNPAQPCSHQGRAGAGDLWSF